MKDFLLLSCANVITYKEFFPLIKENKARAGYNFNKTLYFETPEGETKKQTAISWFTTLTVVNKPILTLTKTYNQVDYPKYDNYDAVEVSKCKDMPYDYSGYMGCPITLLKYDLKQFEIVGMAAGARDITGIPFTGDIPGPFIGGGQSMQEYSLEDALNTPVINGTRIYKRIIIKRNDKHRCT